MFLPLEMTSNEIPAIAAGTVWVPKQLSIFLNQTELIDSHKIETEIEPISSVRVPRLPEFIYLYQKFLNSL